jgi:hypothetical protein
MCSYPLEAIAIPAQTLSLDAVSHADIRRGAYSGCGAFAQAMAALAKGGREDDSGGDRTGGGCELGMGDWGREHCG